MNIKKIVLFTVILMMVISSLGMVSAGWFDFLGGNGGDSQGNMTLTCYGEHSSQEGCIVLECLILTSSDNLTSNIWHSSSDEVNTTGPGQLDAKDEYLYINVTDESGNLVKSENVSLNNITFTKGNSSEAEGKYVYSVAGSLTPTIGPLEDGNYTVSVYFPGYGDIAELHYNKTVEIKEDTTPVKSNQSSSSSNEGVFVFQKGDQITKLDSKGNVVP